MRLDVEENKNGVHINAYDGGRRVASGSGKSVKDAAKWLLRHVNRIANQTESLIENMGILTEVEIEDVLTEGAVDVGSD